MHGVFIEQDDDARALILVSLDGDLEEAQREARRSFGSKADDALGIRRQQRDEFAARNRRFDAAKGTDDERAIGSADAAFGADQRDHDPGFGEAIAPIPLDRAKRLSNAVDAARRPEAPDQAILGGTGTNDFGVKTAAIAGNAKRVGVAIAPRGTSCCRQAIDVARINRKARRGRCAAEHHFMCGIGANDPSAAIGDCNGDIILVSGHADQRPVDATIHLDLTRIKVAQSKDQRGTDQAGCAKRGGDHRLVGNAEYEQRRNDRTRNHGDADQAISIAAFAETRLPRHQPLSLNRRAASRFQSFSFSYSRLS